MTRMLDEIRAALGAAAEENEGGAYLKVREEDFKKTIEALHSSGFELISLFYTTSFRSLKGVLMYAFEKKGIDGIAFMYYSPMGAGYSIASLYPSASWYERETRDLYGIDFQDAFDKRPLVRHDAGYEFIHLEGEGVYEIPVGPVHAGIIEPGHFRFNVIGEKIYSLEVRLFYKHRGLERMAEGKRPEECVKIAESISGDESMANGFAFCNAVERIAGIEVPERAQCLRMIYLELERVYSHLGDLAGMAVDVAYPCGASPFLIMREDVLRLNQRLTGSRFLKNTLCIGGLRRDAPQSVTDTLSSFTRSLSTAFDEAYGAVIGSPSAVDRFEKTGIIEPGLVKPLHLSGPAARASGSSSDTRQDHPYCMYSLFRPEVKTGSAGDVLARFDVKAAEVKESISLVERLAGRLSGKDFKAECQLKDGEHMSLVEAARGQNLHWVQIKDGRIERYKVRTASYCNWQALGHAVIGDIVPDFPLVNKSLNLSYAGTDL